MFPLVDLHGSPGGNAFRKFPLDYCARRLYAKHLEEDGKGFVVGI